MSSNSVCNHSHDEQIGLPLHNVQVITRLIANRIGPPYSYYHSLNLDFLPTILFLVLILYPHPIYKKALSILVPKHSLCALRPVDIFTPRGVLVFVVNGHEIQRVNGRLLETIANSFGH